MLARTTLVSSSPPTSSSESSSSRTSRLRGLNLLRTVAHHHHLSSLHHSANSPSSADRSPAALSSSPTSTSPPVSPTSPSSPQDASSPHLPLSSRLFSAASLSRKHPERQDTNHSSAMPSAWVPSVNTLTNLSRVGSTPVPVQTPTTAARASGTTPHTRSRSDSAPARGVDQNMSPGGGQYNAGSNTSPGSGLENANGFNGEGNPDSPTVPTAATIRFVPHVDHRSTRPSLAFTAVDRTLMPGSNETIKVGRYSDRDNINNSGRVGDLNGLSANIAAFNLMGAETGHNSPGLGVGTPPQGSASGHTGQVTTYNSAPVGFKSKVVSRRHCEFWVDQQGAWFLKDVKSSSGTFLNHIRLASPGNESKPFKLHDGDIVQLGIDFKGGEEQIYRCVKIRVELNRGWQKSLNAFNKSAHKRLRNLGKKEVTEASSIHSSECSICLMSVAPCQALFVAPCSHVWHYKCIRPLVVRHYPQFPCPNCRAVSDLERDIEEDQVEDEEKWETLPEDGDEKAGMPPETLDESNPAASSIIHTRVSHPDPPRRSTQLERIPSVESEVEGDVAMSGFGPDRSGTPASGDSQERLAVDERMNLGHLSRQATIGNVAGATEEGPSPQDDHPRQEGVMTPTNDAGPFVFDRAR